MHLTAEVREVEKLTARVKLYVLELKERLGSWPGQFVMVWLPGSGEIPISVARERGREIWLVIARVGRVTGAIHEEVGEGARLWIRGPYGRGFSTSPGRHLLVGGGFGVAPLLRLADELRALDGPVEVWAALGFKSADDALLLEEFKEVVDRVTVSTDDGTLGEKGLVTDVVELDWPNVVHASGPEPMLRALAFSCLQRGVRLEISLERRMRCGLGLCGSCEVESTGMRVCRDGPVFDARLLASAEFARRSLEVWA